MCHEIYVLVVNNIYKIYLHIFQSGGFQNFTYNKKIVFLKFLYKINIFIIFVKLAYLLYFVVQSNSKLFSSWYIFTDLFHICFYQLFVFVGILFLTNLFLSSLFLDYRVLLARNFFRLSARNIILSFLFLKYRRAVRRIKGWRSKGG